MSVDFPLRLCHYPEDVPEHDSVILFYAFGIRSFDLVQYSCKIANTFPNHEPEGKYCDTYFFLNEITSGVSREHPGKFYFVNVTDVDRVIADIGLKDISDKRRERRNRKRTKE